MNDQQIKELLRLKSEIAQARTVKALYLITAEAIKWASKNLPNDGIHRRSLIYLIEETQKRIQSKRRK